jgi:hypothetical protein
VRPFLCEQKLIKPLQSCVAQPASTNARSNDRTASAAPRIRSAAPPCAVEGAQGECSFGARAASDCHGAVEGVAALRLRAHPVCRRHPAHPLAGAHQRDAPSRGALLPDRPRRPARPVVGGANVSRVRVLDAVHQGRSRADVRAAAERVEHALLQRRARAVRGEVYGDSHQGEGVCDFHSTARL